jgi:DNA-binding response OmpR family regulator
MNDLRVGDWLVAPSLNSMSSEGRTVRLEPKVMGVLLCLAQHPGETLSKEQLFQAVWPKTVVTEDVLKRCIAELRRAFFPDTFPTPRGCTAIRGFARSLHRWGAMTGCPIASRALQTAIDGAPG